MPGSRSTGCWRCPDRRTARPRPGPAAPAATLDPVRLSPKRAQPAEPAADSADGVDAGTAEQVTMTKGRPTPKRRDVTGPRGPVTAPKTRKEAYARQKQQAKAVRTARSKPAASMSAADRRAALR